MSRQKNAFIAITLTVFGAFFCFLFYPDLVSNLFVSSPQKKKTMSMAELASAPSYIQQQELMRELKNQKPMTVELIESSVTDLYTVFQTSGVIVAKDSVAIKVEEPGLVDEIKVKTGQFVKKNSELFTLKKKKAQANLDNAQAELNFRKADLNRYEELLKGKAVPLNKYQEAKAHYDKAVAAVLSAEVALEACSVCAPFDGTVGMVKISPGQYLSPHQGSAPTETVFLVDRSNLYVEFALNSVYRDIVREDKEIEFEMKTRDGQSIKQKAIITDIDVKIDQNQTLKVRAVLDNNNRNTRNIMPGQYVTVVIRYNEKKGIALPKDCFFVDSYGKYYVFITAEEQGMKIAQAMPVEIGLINDVLQTIELTQMRPGLKFVRHVSTLPSTLIRIA